MADDPNQLGWDEIVAAIRAAPDTWIPGLMLECVKQGYKRPIFLPEGASTMVRQLEEKEGFDKEKTG